MATQSGRHYIDGKDLWDTWGIFVESGSNDFLKFPARKDSTTHDWMDSDGIDVDLSLPFFEDKKISLKCAMIATSEAEFWRNYDAFVGEWAKSGTRDLSVKEFDRTFQVYYTDTTNFERFTPIKNMGKIATRFTLNLVEPVPDVSEGDAYIVDETDRFLTT